MSSAVLVPNAATIAHVGTESYTGGSADYTNLSDASDTTYYRVSAGSGDGEFTFPLGTIPADIGTVTGISVAIRASRSSKGDYAELDKLRIVKSDGTTAISSQITGISGTLTTSAANYTFNPTVTLSGQTDWDDAHIRIWNDNGASTGPAYYEISVTITYTEAGPSTAICSQGPNFAGTIVNEAASGDVAWTNPGNVDAEDAAFATATIASVGDETDWIHCSGFTFDVPRGATITGIRVIVWRKATSGTSIKDSSLRLYKAGSLAGSDLADTSTAWPTSNAMAEYGDDGEMWGLALTPDDVNSPDFGVGLKAGIPSGSGSLQANVDSIEVMVFFSLAVTKTPVYPPFEVVRPVSAVGTVWTTYDPTYIDTEVFIPDTGDPNDCWDSGYGSGPQGWTMVAPARAGKIESVKLNVLCRSDAANGGHLISARIKLNGNWYSWGTFFSRLDDVPMWHCFYFTGLSEEAVGSAPEIELEMVGAGGGSFMYLDEAYLELRGPNNGGDFLTLLM